MFQIDFHKPVVFREMRNQNVSVFAATKTAEDVYCFK